MSKDVSNASKIIKSSKTFLSRWKGARVELREMTHSHRTLTLVLTRISSAENLVFLCLEPLSIHANIVWENSDLDISEVSLPGHNQATFRILDKKLQF